MNLWMDIWPDTEPAAVKFPLTKLAELISVPSATGKMRAAVYFGWMVALCFFRKTMNNFVKALKKVVDGYDAFDILLFVIFLIIIPPVPIIWLIVRLIQEWE